MLEIIYKNDIDCMNVAIKLDDFMKSYKIIINKYREIDELKFALEQIRHEKSLLIQLVRLYMLGRQSKLFIDSIESILSKYSSTPTETWFNIFDNYTKYSEDINNLDLSNDSTPLPEVYWKYPYKFNMTKDVNKLKHYDIPLEYMLNKETKHDIEQTIKESEDEVILLFRRILYLHLYVSNKNKI